MSCEVQCVYPGGVGLQYNDYHSTKHLHDGHWCSNMFILLSYLLYLNKIMFILISQSLLTFSPVFFCHNLRLNCKDPYYTAQVFIWGNCKTISYHLTKPAGLLWVWMGQVEKRIENLNCTFNSFIKVQTKSNVFSVSYHVW